MEALGIRIVGSIYLASSKGKITLKSNDPNDQPSLDFHLLEDPEDLRRLREAVRIAVDLLKHSEFDEIIEKRLEPLDSDLDSEDSLNKWLLKEVTTGQHLTGTCKMGPSSDQMAVVDEELRVQGVEGLRIADASIMPNTVRANTNATTIMIGERVAAFLKNN